jgi:DnaJ-class molecular chaperone
MSKNLVELMAQEVDIGDWSVATDAEKEEPIELAKAMLSVVKEHIGEVAKKCPECDDGIIYFENDFGHSKTKPCQTCKGTGVIARTEGDV